jgi:hypothetical protein
MEYCQDNLLKLGGKLTYSGNAGNAIPFISRHLRDLPEWQYWETRSAEAGPGAQKVS